jgi:hypothetical protein
MARRAKGGDSADEAQARLSELSAFDSVIHAKRPRLVVCVRADRGRIRSPGSGVTQGTLRLDGVDVEGFPVSLPDRPGETLSRSGDRR